MDLQVTFIGTSASVPSAARGTSATLIARGGARWLVDCGEGTQRQLLREVWGPQGDGQTHYLRVYANHLRKKLGAHLILSNEPGIGYRLLAPPC